MGDRCVFRGESSNQSISNRAIAMGQTDATASPNDDEHKTHCGDEAVSNNCDLADAKRTHKRPDNCAISTFFVLLGASSLIAWNSLLTLLNPSRSVLWPDLGSFTDTVTAAYFTVVLIVTVTFAKLDAAREWVIIAGLTSVGLLCLTLGFICGYASVSPFGTGRPALRTSMHPFYLFCCSLTPHPLCFTPSVAAWG